mmetsp:Transcript_9975/g.23813  ORF Transcript_9975/g.23813 Transcript_9975/m.23813 type:complete len:200 (-) Transcript_9975:303-902(-)
MTTKRLSPTDLSGIFLRVLVVLGSVSGIGLAILALVMEFPPKSVPAWALVVLGILTCLAGILGIIGSYRQGFCLLVYCIIGTIAFLLQATVLVGLFFFQDDTIRAFTGGDEARRSLIEPYLSVGRWVLLSFVAVQLLALVTALCGRLCLNREPMFQDLETAQDRELHMQTLREDIMARGEGGKYAGVAKRMREKYGEDL